MWLDDSAEAIHDIDGRIDADFFVPAKQKYASAEETIVEKAKSTDDALTDKVPFYTRLKTILAGLWKDFIETTRPLQEYMVSLLDNKIVGRCLSFVQTGIRWIAYFVFFLMGFAVSQIRTHTIRNNLRSPWASLLFLPAFLGVLFVVIVSYLMEIPATVRTGFIDGRLPTLVTVIAKPFQSALPTATKISPTLGNVVKFSRDVTIVLILGIPVASMEILDYYKPPVSEEETNLKATDQK